ncbi:terpene synthase family protein [Nocardia suismassiliense]|uniref:Terpene synthase n=1 Tax=Nocardia suismassiliense TaxID=2077092 RepID=A0ABW6R6W1_9NOCA
MSALGIVTDSDALTYVDAMRLDLYAGRCAPRLDGDRLELFCDWVLWTVLLDDHLDGLEPDRLRDRILVLVRLLDRDDPEYLPPDAGPFPRGLSDLWTRMQDMPDRWRLRLADRWSEWLECYLIEADWRARRWWPSPARYLQLRRISSAVHPFLQLTDWLHGTCLDDRILESGQISALRQCVNDHTMDVNDILSHQREHQAGDHLNAVFVLQHAHRCTRTEAITLVAQHATDTLTHHRWLEHNLDVISTDLRATSQERQDITAMAQSLREWIRGNLDWHLHDTGRYAGTLRALGKQPTPAHLPRGSESTDHGHERGHGSDPRRALRSGSTGGRSNPSGRPA